MPRRSAATPGSAPPLHSSPRRLNSAPASASSAARPRYNSWATPRGVADRQDTGSLEPSPRSQRTRPLPRSPSGVTAAPQPRGECPGARRHRSLRPGGSSPGRSWTRRTLRRGTRGGAGPGPARTTRTAVRLPAAGHTRPPFRPSVDELVTLICRRTVHPRTILLLPQHEVHHPAPADVRAGATRRTSATNWFVRSRPNSSRESPKSTRGLRTTSTRMAMPASVGERQVQPRSQEQRTGFSTSDEVLRDLLGGGLLVRWQRDRARHSFLLRPSSIHRTTSVRLVPADSAGRTGSERCFWYGDLPAQLSSVGVHLTAIAPRESAPATWCGRWPALFCDFVVTLPRRVCIR